MIKAIFCYNISLRKECGLFECTTKEMNSVIRVKVIIHNAEEGGFWAEIPSIEGYATQGETIEELIQNIYEAVEGCLAVDITEYNISDSGRVMELMI